MAVLLPVTMVRRPVFTNAETNLKVRTSAERLSRACQDDYFHAFVDIEDGEELLEVPNHLRSERIVFGRTIQRYDDDGGNCRCAWGVVGDDDMAGCFDLFIRRWKLNGAGIEDHDRCWVVY